MTKLVALIVFAVLAVAPTSGSAGEATGSIRGVIYHDLDRDGVRDAGEPGLHGRGVILSSGGEQIDAAGTGPDGSYLFEGLVDGSHALEASVHTSGGECSDYGFTFNPYANQSYCVNYKVPWSATPSGLVYVAVQDGNEIVQDFGAYEADAMIVAGIALLEGDRAPEGTTIEAVFNGVECGSTMARGPKSELTYVLHVRGAGEREGCPSSGDTLHFRIGGLDSPEVRFYQPWLATPERRLQLQPLTAIRQHSWLWAGRRTSEAPPAGTIVEALAGETVCGSVQVEYIGGEAGFSRLLVASDELIDGCGAEGSTLSFRTQALDGAVTLPWSAHLREVTLRFYGDVNCDYGASAVDALLVLQVVSGRQSGLPCPEGSDVNSSGATDAIDAALVLQHSAGFVERLPVGVIAAASVTRVS